MIETKAAKILPLLVAVMLCLPVSASGVDSAVAIASLSVSPQPVVAGQNVTVSFNLFNTYTGVLKNPIIQVSAPPPIQNVSPTNFYVASIIAQGSFGSNLYNYFTYRFHVPSTTVAGNYRMNITTYYTASVGSTDTPGVSVDPINIYVYGIPNIQLSATPQGQITPGGQTTFTLSAINTGTDMARNVTATLLSSANYTAYGTNRVNFGIMAVGASQSATIVLQTSGSLKQGLVNVPVQISYTAQSGINTTTIVYVPVSFVPASPYIVASIVSANPTQLYPGGNQTATIQLQNIGHGDARNLSAKFQSGQGITVAGSASTFFVGTLTAGASTTVNLFISANSSISAVNASIPVLLKYYSLNSNINLTRTQYVPIKVQNSAIFNVTAVRGSVASGATYVPITYTIKNTGNIAAQQITFSLQTIYPLTPVNPTVYVNQLLPGQSINATFYVNVDTHGQSGTYPVIVYEQWRQPNGYTTQQYSSSSNYYATVGSGSALQNLASYIILIVVIAVGGFIYYTRFYKGEREMPKQIAAIANKISALRKRKGNK